MQINRNFEKLLDEYKKQNNTSAIDYGMTLPFPLFKETRCPDILKSITGLSKKKILEMESEYAHNHTKSIYLEISEYKGLIIEKLCMKEVKSLFKELTEEFKKCPYFYGSILKGSTRNDFGIKSLSIRWTLPFILPVGNHIIFTENLRNSLEEYFSCKINYIRAIRPDCSDYENSEAYAEVLFKQQLMLRILYNAAGIEIAYKPIKANSAEKEI